MLEITKFIEKAIKERRKKKEAKESANILEKIIEEKLRHKDYNCCEGGVRVLIDLAPFDIEELIYNKLVRDELKKRWREVELKYCGNIIEGDWIEVKLLK